MSPLLWLVLLAVTVTAKEGCLPDCTCGNKEGYRVLDCGKLPTRALPDQTTPTKLTVRNNKPVLYKYEVQALRPRNVVELDMCNSGLQTIKSNALQMLPALRVVRLSHNLITTIQISTFLNNEQLREIYLDGNRISMLAVGCFATLPNLEGLYLQHNHIAEIPKLPDQLKTVDLSFNKIERIPQSFQAKESLNAMDLCGNPVTDLPSVCFKQNHLRSLCLGNGDPQLQQGTGKQLSEVENITLSSEKLPHQVLSETNIAELTQMKKLKHLAVNHYTLPSLEFLHEMPLLEGLCFNHDKVNSLGETELLKALSGKPKLTELNLEGSKELALLVLTDNKVWEHLGGLTKLGLADCGLKEVHLHLQPGRTLTIDISNNPLHCDCALIQPLDNIYLDNCEKTLCETPEVYRGQSPDPTMCPAVKPEPNKHLDTAVGPNLIGPEDSKVDWRDDFKKQRDVPENQVKDWEQEKHTSLEEAEQKDESWNPTLPHEEDGDELFEFKKFEDISKDELENQPGHVPPNEQRKNKPQHDQEIPHKPEHHDEENKPDHEPHPDAEHGEQTGHHNEEQEPHNNEKHEENHVAEHDEQTEQNNEEQNPHHNEEHEQNHDAEHGEQVGHEEHTPHHETEQGEHTENFETTEEWNHDQTDDYEHEHSEHQEHPEKDTAKTIIYVLVGVVILLAVIAIIIFIVLRCYFKKKGHHNLEAHHNEPIKSSKSECTSEDSLLKNLKK